MRQESKKYTNKDGKKCEILIKRNFKNKRVMLIMYYPNIVEPHYYIPNKVFKDPNEIIEHILDNLETDNLRVIVEPSKDNINY